MASDELTTLQRKAIAKILLTIANAHGTVTKNQERLFIVIKTVAYNISESDVEDSKHMNLSDCVTIIRELSINNKKNLFHYMLNLATADSSHSDEIKMLMTICKEAEIPLPEELARFSKLF